MNNPQQKNSKMLGILREEYNKNKTVYATIPAMVSAFDRIFLLYDEIGVLSQSQSKDNTGVTKTKAEIKKMLNDEGYKHASGIFAWAADTENTTILEQVNFGETYLLKLNDQLIVAPCRNIYGLAVENLAALANFGINEASLAQLSAAIQAFVNVLPSSKKNISDRSIDTKKMAALFAEIKRMIANKLEKLAVQLKDNNPDVYNSFKAAIALPKSSSAPKKDATNKNGNPKALPAPTE